MVWLTQFQDTLTEWDIRLSFWRPGLPVARYYKVIVSVHCHKSVPVLIWPKMMPGPKTPTTNQRPLTAQSKQVYSHRSSFKCYCLWYTVLNATLLNRSPRLLHLLLLYHGCQPLLFHRKVHRDFMSPSSPYGDLPIFLFFNICWSLSQMRK